MPIIIFSLLFWIVTLAQEVELPSPGLTPDSPFYFFDTLGEKIAMFFTFGAEKKAEKALKFAEEKLAEVKVMVEKNRTKAVEKATQKYQDFLNVANIKIQEAKEKGKDVEELVILITEKILKHQEVLVDVFEKVPEEAKTAIQKAIEISTKGSEEAVQAVTGAKKEELLQKIEETRIGVEERITSALAKLTPEEVFAKVAPAVVQIINDGFISPGFGSGMIIDATGYILTNEHVIKGDSSVDIYLGDGRTLNGLVIGWNEIVDLAIVKISGDNFNYVTFGDSDAVKQGEDIFVFGYSDTGLPTMNFESGIITAKYPPEDVLYFQTNAIARPGNSGGPWVDSKAKVIGVMNLKYPGISAGKGLAIPINIAKSVLSDLKAGIKISLPAETPGPESEIPKVMGKFLESWVDKDYGKMSTFMVNDVGQSPIDQEDIRKTFEQDPIISYNIEKVVDYSEVSTPPYPLIGFADGKIVNFTVIHEETKKEVNLSFVVVWHISKWKILTTRGLGGFLFYIYEHLHRFARNEPSEFYTNEELGFKLQIPAGWKYKTERISKGMFEGIPTTFEVIFANEDDPFSRIYISGMELGPNVTLEDRIEVAIRFIQANEVLISQDPTTLGGINAWEIIKKYESEATVMEKKVRYYLKSRTIFTVRNAKEYGAILIVARENPEDLDPVFNSLESDFEKFVQTFEFTD